MSDALGTATELKAMKNYAGHRLSPWLGHLMVSRSETARQLLTPGEVMQLPPSDEIVMVSGVQPIRARKVRYFEDRRLQERVAKPPAVKTPDRLREDDWSGLPPIARRPSTGESAISVDHANGGIRREPELQRHEDIVPKPKRPKQEFDFRDSDASDADAVRARRLQEQMRGVAQRASLDPGDGIQL